ncbi:formate--tetrahydrofolate ligase [Prevotella salivae]|uniref:Formate--tetrahydrofolate ligase n=1 Tax=Segatella salivae TaxID=228604 RepID=A0AAW4NT79_9BACT|nr:formate--tetrahydrofolate ligase [Segatella salivae]MBW4866473.1 formate--tetrahydrofolate ligase [Segatella salivae]MBW4910426.1 formate--tetrahydrofolate ligase [Segatella salivae]
MKTELEIARECQLQPIEKIADKINIPNEELENYGKYIAKVSYHLIDKDRVNKSNLILVTAISPTKSGIGKTTVSIGLSMAMNRLGHKSVLALREPSLGPCFGMKGGATGGGYAQVLPMDKINLHFTGDFHAITSAHNMIAALLDNYLYQHHDEGFALKEVLWRRVLDVNDRNLRTIATGLGPKTNGLLSESGFDITPASEIMAILCLATDEEDLRRRIDNILLGVTLDNKPFCVKDLGVGGAITVLLRDALNPNLVQTIEGTPAFIHGGPFANIAHGCNSVLATKMAMTFGDFVVTEAGFGADLGAEKFIDIKCRKAGIQPRLTIMVATIMGLKMHGGMQVGDPENGCCEHIRKGLENLDKHIANMQHMGQSVIVTLNRFGSDTDEEIAIVSEHCREKGIGFALNEAYMKGSEGCMDLARLAVDEIAANPSRDITYCYADTDTVQDKITAVATRIYGAKKVVFKKQALKMIERISQWQLEHFPICIAKTQYSLSDDSKRYGVPKDFTLTISDLVINTGAEMIVVIAGDIMRMPGLPRHPQAERIDIQDGLLVGLE